MSINWFKQKPKTIAEISAINHKSYLEYLGGLGWQTLGSKPEMILVYTDREGNNYYVAKNSWQGISRDRLAALERATLAMEYRMSREEVMKKLHSVSQNLLKCQRGDTEAAHNGYKEAWELLEIMKSAPSDQVLMQYALHVIYTDGENPETIDPEFIKMKSARAEADNALKAFFLNMAHSTVNNSLPILSQDGQNFMDQEAERQKKREASRMQLAKLKETGKLKGN